MEKVNDINKNMMQFFGNGAWNSEACIDLHLDPNQVQCIP